MELIDIYILLEKDLKKLHSFIQMYSNGNFDKIIGQDYYLKNSDEWISFISFNDLIEFGFQNNSDHISLYFDPLEEDVKSVIVSLNSDNSMVFGVSIQHTGEKEDDFKLNDLKLSLASKFDAMATCYGWELPPPSSKVSFLKLSQKGI